MTKVRVTQHIAGNLDAVFDLISNHETFLSRFPGMQVRIVTQGSPERNGLGCIREVLVGTKIRYLEEIVEWSKPTSFEYLIREASMPIRHYGSRLEFTSASSGGTDVTWTSHYNVPILTHCLIKLVTVPGGNEDWSLQRFFSMVNATIFKIRAL